MNATCQPDEILPEREDRSETYDPPRPCASNTGGGQGMPHVQQVLRSSGSGFQGARDQNLFAS